MRSFSSAAGFTTGGISLFDEPEQLTLSEFYILIAVTHSW